MISGPSHGSSRSLNPLVRSATTSGSVNPLSTPRVTHLPRSGVLTKDYSQESLSSDRFSDLPSPRASSSCSPRSPCLSRPPRSSLNWESSSAINKSDVPVRLSVGDTVRVKSDFRAPGARFGALSTLSRGTEGRVESITALGDAIVVFDGMFGYKRVPAKFVDNLKIIGFKPVDTVKIGHLDAKSADLLEASACKTLRPLQADADLEEIKLEIDLPRETVAPKKVCISNHQQGSPQLPKREFCADGCRSSAVCVACEGLILLVLISVLCLSIVVRSWVAALTSVLTWHVLNACLQCCGSMEAAGVAQILEELDTAIEHEAALLHLQNLCASRPEIQIVGEAFEMSDHSSTSEAPKVTYSARWDLDYDTWRDASAPIAGLDSHQFVLLSVVTEFTYADSASEQTVSQLLHDMQVNCWGTGTHVRVIADNVAADQGADCKTFVTRRSGSRRPCWMSIWCYVTCSLAVPLLGTLYSLVFWCKVPKLRYKVVKEIGIKNSVDIGTESTHSRFVVGHSSNTLLGCPQATKDVDATRD